MRPSRGLLLLLTIIGFVAVTAALTARSPGDAAAPQPAPATPGPFVAPVVPPSPGPGLLRKLPNLDGTLDLLYRIDLLARNAGGRVDATSAASLPPALAAPIAAKYLRLDDDGFIHVHADTYGDPTLAADALSALGMRIETVSGEYGLVQGRLPVSAIEQAAALPEVRFLRPPAYAFVDTGSVNSQGDAILDANDLRSTFGVNGAGVRVGVISDGLEGLAAAQGSGDLPGSVNTSCDFGPGLPTDPGAGAEGTAMLEIVHDLAPGAELWFGYFALGTSADFISAVDCLADNVDVIIDDISFFNVGSYNGTSNVSQNLAAEMNDVSNRVRAYHKSVGNNALDHYQETYVDFAPLDGNNQTHRFQATASTTDQLPIGGSGININPVYLVSGGTVAIALQWNDTFGASANDYDLYLFRDSDLAQVAQSEGVQSGTQNPVETIVYQNTGASGFFDILINKFSGATGTFDMFVPVCDCVPLPNGMGNEPVLNYNTLSSSVPNNADASGRVVTHGAINASEPGNDAIAPYSSRGPTNDARLKPEAVAIDGVNVSGAGGFPSPGCAPQCVFFGTSAAAPHGGAIAALILACRPVLKHGEPGDNPNGDRDALRNAMLDTAVDLGAGGDDQVYGNGRIDADAAATSAGCTPATPTPTPTRTNTPTPTPTRTNTPTPTPTKTNTPTPTPSSTSTPTATPTSTTDTDGDGMPNTYENARACLDAAVADGELDPDIDNLTSAFEFLTAGTEPCVNDTDTDGCADGEELVDSVGSHLFGGERDPLNHYDFYDVNGSRKIDAVDVNLVRANFNGIGPTPPEDLIYDRYIGVAPWAPGPPDNRINAVDINLVRAAFNNSCILAP